MLECVPAVSEAAPQRGAPVAVCLKLETGPQESECVSLTDDGCDDKLEDGALTNQRAPVYSADQSEACGAVLILGG